MCLIALAIGASSRWPLLIASNRDEFLDRPTLPLSRWTTDHGTEIISGRDLRAGGTWLGMTAQGRVAMLTNVREPGQADATRSRGDLTLNWLASEVRVDEFLLSLESVAFGGCNLVLGDLTSSQWTWVTNRPSLKAQTETESGLDAWSDWNGWRGKHLRPGIYGLSNALLDTPWPKTRALKAAVSGALLTAEAETLKEQLWAALENKQRFDLADLPRTGVSTELEHGLSSVFVDLPEQVYGTRCSTLVVLEKANSAPNIKSGWTISIDEKTSVRAGQNIASSSQLMTLRWPFDL